MHQIVIRYVQPLVRQYRLHRRVAVTDRPDRVRVPNQTDYARHDRPAYENGEQNVHPFDVVIELQQEEHRRHAYIREDSLHIADTAGSPSSDRYQTDERYGRNQWDEMRVAYSSRCDLRRALEAPERGPQQEQNYVKVHESTRMQVRSRNRKDIPGHRRSEEQLVRVESAGFSRQRCLQRGCYP